MSSIEIGPEGTKRPGGGARGGIKPQPDDPTSPAAAAERAKGGNRDLADAGFGDHAGGTLRGPQEKGGEQR